jgi:hypothetical protein
MPLMTAMFVFVRAAIPKNYLRTCDCQLLA